MRQHGGPSKGFSRGPGEGNKASALEAVHEDRPLDLFYELGHGDVPGAGLGAVVGGAAPPDPAPRAQNLETLPLAPVAGVKDKAVGLDDGGGTDVGAVHPEDGAARGAACAEDALGALVKPLPFLGGLEPLPLGRGLVVDEVGLHRQVGGEEGLHVHDEVLLHREATDGLHGDHVPQIPDQGLAGQAVPAVDEHGVGPADAVAAAPSEG